MDGIDSNRTSIPIYEFDWVGLGTSNLTIPEIKEKTAWIRDDLEPVVARCGPASLPIDHVLELHSFLHKLRRAQAGLDTDQSAELVITPRNLRITRIHLALLQLRGLATRWPSKIVSLCEIVIAKWVNIFGDLTLIRPLLYEPGGRLSGLAENAALSRSAMLIKWLSDPNSLVNPLRALESGHLEFQPGQWWIHPIFAFHDGIISSPDPSGGITADNDGAYAILVTDYDEVWHKEYPEVLEETFRYRCKKKDEFKFKLTASIFQPKPTVRVLRSHTLHGYTRPTVGVRYEGLYKVIGFGSRPVDGQTAWEVTLARESDQASMMEVSKRPTAEEEEDYHEYVRTRNNAMLKTHSRRQSAAVLDNSQGTLVDRSHASPRLSIETSDRGDISLPFRHRPAISGDIIGLAPEQEPQERSISGLESSRVTTAASIPTTHIPELEAVNSRLLEYQQQQQEGQDNEFELSPVRYPPLDETCANVTTQEVLDVSMALGNQSASVPTQRRRSINAGSSCEQDHTVYLGPIDKKGGKNRRRSGSDTGANMAEDHRRKDSGFCLSNDLVENTPHSLDGVLELRGRSELNHIHLEHLAQTIKNLTSTILSRKVIGKSFFCDILAINVTVERWIRQDEIVNESANFSLQSVNGDFHEVIQEVSLVDDEDSNSLYDFAETVRNYAKGCQDEQIKTLLEERVEQHESTRKLAKKSVLAKKTQLRTKLSNLALRQEELSSEGSSSGARFYRRRGGISE